MKKSTVQVKCVLVFICFSFPSCYFKAVIKLFRGRGYVTDLSLKKQQHVSCRAILCSRVFCKSWRLQDAEFYNMLFRHLSEFKQPGAPIWSKCFSLVSFHPLLIKVCHLFAQAPLYRRGELQPVGSQKDFLFQLSLKNTRSALLTVRGFSVFI